MKTLSQKSHVHGHKLVVNKRGVKFCYLSSKVTTTGGGTYLTRALAARAETEADVLVFMIPGGPNAERNRERIMRGRDDLMSAVKPLILPFKIVVMIGTNQSLAENYFSTMTWSDVKY